jgi:hypothetical protein
MFRSKPPLPPAPPPPAPAASPALPATPHDPLLPPPAPKPVVTQPARPPKSRKRHRVVQSNNPRVSASPLTGAGLGAGLAFAVERRWRAVAASLVSLVLAWATVPLFQATLGRYRFYVIEVQRSHPIEWERLAQRPLTAQGRVVLAAAALIVGIRRLDAAGDGFAARAVRALSPPMLSRLAVQRLLLFTGIVVLASLPAWLKYAGRDNNLTLPGHRRRVRRRSRHRRARAARRSDDPPFVRAVGGSPRARGRRAARAAQGPFNHTAPRGRSPRADPGARMPRRAVRPFLSSRWRLGSRRAVGTWPAIE